MNIIELMEKLEDVRRDYGDDVTIRIAMQPHWPFEYSVGTVEINDPSQLLEAVEDEDGWHVIAPDGAEVAGPLTREEAFGKIDGTTIEGERVLYISEGSQIGYLPGDARMVLGWS